MQGKIKRLLSKGFGFIEDDKGIDFFFHYSAYKGDFKQLVKKFICLKQGEVITVKFDNDESSPSGPRAINVEVSD